MAKSLSETILRTLNVVKILKKTFGFVLKLTTVSICLNNTQKTQSKLNSAKTKVNSEKKIVIVFALIEREEREIAEM